MTRSEAWFKNSIANLRRAVAEADKEHTPDEITAAEMALATPRAARQPSLFSGPPNAGLITGGQPEPTGLAVRGHVGR